MTIPFLFFILFVTMDGKIFGVWMSPKLHFEEYFMQRRVREKSILCISQHNGVHYTCCKFPASTQ